MSTVDVYRIGSLTPAVYEDQVLHFAEAADAVRPYYYNPRHGSIYASPTLQGLLRWASNREGTIHKIQVSVDCLAFPVSAWEEAFWGSGSFREYWEAGISLEDYFKRPNPREDSAWEVLLVPENIWQVNEVSVDDLIAAAVGTEYETSIRERFSS